MSAKSADHLWKAYPGSHLHCDVMTSGPDSYQIIMSLLAENGAEIGRVVHYGTGDLTRLKDEALNKLIAELEIAGQL